MATLALAAKGGLLVTRCMVLSVRTGCLPAVEHYCRSSNHPSSNRCRERPADRHRCNGHKRNWATEPGDAECTDADTLAGVVWMAMKVSLSCSVRLSCWSAISHNEVMNVEKSDTTTLEMFTRRLSKDEIACSEVRLTLD